MAKKGVTKARRRGFELQSSELWGSKIDLSAQLQIQLMGFETKSVPFFRLKVSTLFVFSIQTNSGNVSLALLLDRPGASSTSYKLAAAPLVMCNLI